MFKSFRGTAGILLLLSCGLACSRLWPRPLVWHLTLQVDAPPTERRAATKRAAAVLESRLDALGVSNFEVKPDNDPDSGRIRLNLPALRDADRVAQLVTAEGRLELTALVGPPNPAPAQTYVSKDEAVSSLNSEGAIPENRRVLRYSERVEPGENSTSPEKWVVVEAPPIVAADELRNAQAVATRGGEYEIQFSLKKVGAQAFSQWTASHINDYLAVVLNDEVKTVAFVKSQISDSGVLNGRFTKQAAEDLALVLRSGSMPHVTVVEEKVDK